MFVLGWVDATPAGRARRGAARAGRRRRGRTRRPQAGRAGRDRSCPLAPRRSRACGRAAAVGGGSGGARVLACRRAPARARDLRRLRSGDDGAQAGPRAAVRVRRGARRAARADRDVPVAREPGRTAAAGRRRVDRPPRRAVAASAAGRSRRARLPCVRGRRRSRRAQRTLRHGVPRQRDDEIDGRPPRRLRRRHRRPRAAAARPAAREPRGARAPLRHGREAVPPRASGRGGDRGDPPAADRDGAGTRGADRRRSDRARGDAAPARAHAPLARVRRPAEAGRLPLQRRHEQVLYVGRARDVRARLRSYFRSERQRPAVEAALGALHRIEWRVTGSELEAGLEELRLIRELRPPANARSARPDRYTYLRRRGEGVVCSSQPTELGPLKSRRRAQAAARALEGLEWESPADALPPLRAKLRRLARDQRYEDAARLRDRIDALEHVTREVARLERLRRLEVCVVAPGLAEGARTAFFVAKGQVVCARPLVACDTLSQATGGPEIAAGLAAVERAEPTLAPEAADELLLVASFLRRPPPELEVVTLAHLRRWTSFASGRAA